MAATGRTSWARPKVSLEGQTDLQGFEDRLGTLGYYSKIMDEDEYRKIQSYKAGSSKACSTSLPVNGWHLGSNLPRLGFPEAASNAL